MLSSLNAPAASLVKPATSAAPARGRAVISKAQGSAQQKELQLIGPEPQRFAVAKGQLTTIASAAFPFLMRLGSGGFVSGYSVSLVKDDGKYAMLEGLGRKMREESAALSGFNRPQQPITLYEFEGCPFCRKVREAVNILDLDVLFKPCPKDGPNWRPEANQKGGKRMFPYMVDDNTGTAMYESDAIISYLFNTYGDGKVPLGLRLGPLTAISCGLAMLPRALKGSAYTPSKLPTQPLVYWGYEASPFCKVVREKLCELELPHIQRSCARGSPKRQELYERRGRFQAPYLEDPNTGKAMFESASIIQYLQDTYAV
ncbi:hypothetical protein D9Q98_001245 [Chlorella vulgaris]|uniref:GST N-terminal domain-containing protein n=1 Tax=Chlorella vulgaris TaxID=3077 RepID=A0A9D4U026_CHLVU|nr:hypothetical protein D9Q98_001245 [Chlorella vulgaris]